MPNFEKRNSKLFKNKEFLYVFIGSFFFFTLKIFLIYLNDTLELMAIEYAYLFCHISLFFISWLYHSSIVLAKVEEKVLLNFFETAWTLKILDYLFVVLFIKIFFYDSNCKYYYYIINNFSSKILIFKEYVFK